MKKIIYIHCIFKKMKILSRISTKIWKTYIKESNDFNDAKILDGEKIININPPKGYFMTADGSFIDENNILFESINKETALGCIFIYNFKNNSFFKLDLDSRYHFSFPLQYNIKNKNYLSFQSNIDNGFIVYEYKYKEDENSCINSVKLERVKIKNNLEEKLIDPVLLLLKEKVYLFSSTKGKPFETRCIGELIFDGDSIFIDKDKKFCKTINGRLAGKFIFEKNKIIASTQLFINSYGDGIAQFEIKKDHIPEKIRTYIYNQGPFYGPHTLNYSPSKKYVIFDICKKSYNPKYTYSKIKQFLNRI